MFLPDTFGHDAIPARPNPADVLGVPLEHGVDDAVVTRFEEDESVPVSDGDGPEQAVRPGKSELDAVRVVPNDDVNEVVPPALVEQNAVAVVRVRIVVHDRVRSLRSRTNPAAPFPFAVLLRTTLSLARRSSRPDSSFSVAVVRSKTTFSTSTPTMPSVLFVAVVPTTVLFSARFNWRPSNSLLRTVLW